ncbi:hypothetical protein E5F05_06715 [Deinococcus metallilatus]|uniref:Uncharacterized protein n=1 Tax=Deinococcus metallilatus TaxID=1211322 RepID=A0AAJ5K643_9DEIO|nr:hypothetical protein [Deinococcus metallilatus]MBB5294639.1 hypothetical protein [Deinococcus metallilatus]QBY07675.1 hypothetical protein E5F05_06715 [Deinococcus metallilatus]RXJ14091.1 hypothetical protein ERJ73_05550 [Deinococcus metallilatus]TLK30056.1 hypothetical protein FCS05_05865 [Deinococcus metallilatus]GMA15852.1 hypothetical protein GCM10025871_21830 [Deinococcus metallilatus]
MNAASRPRPLAPLRARRRVVVLTAISFLGYAILMVLALRVGTLRTPDETLRSLAYLSLLLSFGSGYHLYVPRVLGLPGTDDRRLDERQREVVMQARTQAYWVVSLLFVFGTIYLSLASERGWPLPTGPDSWQLIATGVSFLVGVMPAAILAWTEPDSPGEDLANALPLPDPHAHGGSA